MQTVHTGKGVFGFLSDKKASVLVGTPSSCAVVGYFLKDQEGRYRSQRFFTQLPSRTAYGDERVLVWAYEPTFAEIIDRKSGKVIKSGKLTPGEFLELTGNTELIGNRVLEIRASGPSIGVEVYYDEGFIVPSTTGQGAGKDFYLYAGKITNQVNDVNVIAQTGDAQVTITDLRTRHQLWKGTVKKGAIHSLTVAQSYLRVQSDVPVNVVVAAFAHLQAGYAEHHFGTGIEGQSIDNDFLITTSGELWLFSYYDRNPVTVTDARTGRAVFEGVLGAGGVRGLDSGFGLFRVKSRLGMSVMGGASACGADYSPAAGLFAVDDAVFDVVTQVRAERLQEAKAQGKALSPAAAAAPITAAEYQRYQTRAARASAAARPVVVAGRRAADAAAPAASPAPAPATPPRLSLEEVNQRAATMH
jgi:hypothetical protein